MQGTVRYADLLGAHEFVDLIENYTGTKAQRQGLLEFFCGLENICPGHLRSNAPWLQTYNAPRTPQPNPIPMRRIIELNTSADPLDLARSCAQLALFHGRISDGENYLALLNRYGAADEIGPNINALRALGLTCGIHSNGTPLRLITIIDNGYPVAVHWHDKQTVKAPSPQGTWSIICGYDDTHWHLLDFKGECDSLYGLRKPGQQPGFHTIPFTEFNSRWLFGGQPGLYLTAAG